MNAEGKPGMIEELKRIRSIAWLAAAVVLVLAILDGPVTTLGWILLGSGLVSLFYIAVASTFSLFHNKTHDQ
jgi:hypothetical protein